MLDRFATPLAPWTRCTACNGLLSPARKADVEQLLPPGTRRTYQTFSRCGDCGRVYWRGAHSGRLEAIVDNLRNFAEVNCARDMAIICAVGENLRSDTALFGRAVTSLERIPLRLVSQAASRRNITFVLRNTDVPHAMMRLHETFF